MASSLRLAWSRMRELEEQGLPLLHVYSEGDKAIDYLYAMLGRSVRRWMKKCRGSRFEFVKGANHTFSLLWSQEYVTGIVANWIASEFAGEQHPE